MTFFTQARQFTIDPYVKVFHINEYHLMKKEIHPAQKKCNQYNKICKTQQYNAHYRKSTAACAREETRKRNELQSNKDTNTVENYNLDIITATVFYWKNPMNNALR